MRTETHTTDRRGPNRSRGSDDPLRSSPDREAPQRRSSFSSPFSSHRGGGRGPTGSPTGYHISCRRGRRAAALPPVTHPSVVRGRREAGHGRALRHGAECSSGRRRSAPSSLSRGTRRVTWFHTLHPCVTSMSVPDRQNSTRQPKKGRTRRPRAQATQASEPSTTLKEGKPVSASRAAAILGESSESFTVLRWSLERVFDPATGTVSEIPPEYRIPLLTASQLKRLAPRDPEGHADYLWRKEIRQAWAQTRHMCVPALHGTRRPFGEWSFDDAACESWRRRSRGQEECGGAIEDAA